MRQKGKPDEVPELIGIERQRHHVSASVKSRSEPGRILQPFIMLEAVMLCPCTGSTARDSQCAHLKETLANMDAEELRQWILDSQVIPEDLSADLES